MCTEYWIFGDVDSTLWPEEVETMVKLQRLRDYMSGLCYEGYLHIQHIMEEEHEHISKRILWRPKMVSPMELDELRAIFL